MMMNFVYIITYLSKMLEIKWEIYSLMIALLYMFIEKDIANSINNKTTIQWFQNLKTHRKKI